MQLSSAGIEIRVGMFGMLQAYIDESTDMFRYGIGSHDRSRICMIFGWMERLPEK